MSFQFLNSGEGQILFPSIRKQKHRAVVNGFRLVVRKGVRLGKSSDNALAAFLVSSSAAERQLTSR